MEKIKFPSEGTEYKLSVKGSKFIASVFHTEDEEKALELLAQVRKKHYDATHNCYAYIIYPEIEKFSDDGEPSGSAGRPILSVLKGSGLTNTLVVVTRYYGGTKLGVGGLARAYSGCAKEALLLVEEIEFQEIVLAELNLKFNESQYMYHLSNKIGKIKIVEENYTADGVVFQLKIGTDVLDSFKQKLTEKLNRNQNIKVLEEYFDKI